MPIGLPSTPRYATCSHPTWAPSEPAFGRALHWVYGELVAQRANHWPFLAQLGRDHRKYGVLPTQYGVAARCTTLRDYHRPSKPGAPGRTPSTEPAGQSLNNRGDGGAADADDAPAWWDSTVVEHIQVSRDLAVARLQLDRPLHYYPWPIHVNVHVRMPPPIGSYLSPAVRPARTERIVTSEWFQWPGQQRHRG